MTRATGVKPGRPRRRGAILIIVLGVLSLLALLGITFSTLATTERKISRNYLDMVRARLVALSGMQAALALLPQAVSTHPFPDSSRPETRTWLYFGGELDESRPPTLETPLALARNPSFAYEDEKEQDPSNPNTRPRQIVIDGKLRGFSGITGGTYGIHGDIYALKVRDLSGLIHVNDGVGQQAGNLGSVSQNLERVLNRLGDVLGVSGLGDEIVRNRPAGGYRALRDLEQAIRPELYRKAHPFLTTAAWVDWNVCNPVPLSAAHLADYPVKYYRGEKGSEPLYRHGRGVDVYGRPVAGELATYPPAGGIDSHAVYALDELNPQWIEMVGRAPVNVNQAPREVLIALLADLQGFFLSYRRRNNIEPANVGGYWFPYILHTFSPEGAGAPLNVPSEGDEYGYLYKTLPIKFVQGTTGEDFIDAGKIADEIIACRERRGSYAGAPFGGAFRTWRQFNAFCDHLVATGVLEDRRPIYFDYKANGPVVVKPKNITGHGPLVVSDYERAQASQAIADVLKANFNPNLHLNELNPDANLHALVDKTDLMVNSTEFIFTSTGYFEIEAIGRVLDPQGSPDTFTAGNNNLVAEHKIVACVQIFDLYRETSQSQFMRGTPTARKGRPATNNGLSVEIGPEPDNGPAPLENEWSGSLALPTVTGPARPPRKKGEAVATPEHGPLLGESIGVSFRDDFSAYHHADGIRDDVASVDRVGEAVLNFPDPSEKHSGPYDPLQVSPGHHRLARSFRLPAGPGTATLPSLPKYGPLDLRHDGGYVERHASPAWWITPNSFAPNLKEINVVASFWVKPSYPPDRSGKPRLMLNANKWTGPLVRNMNQAFFAFYYNAGHENEPEQAAFAENMTLCGEPQWWDTNALNFGFSPFRPQSFIFGRGYGPSILAGTPRYYASCQTVVNHESHGDGLESHFREHRWTHVVLVAETRPDEYVYGGGWSSALEPPKYHRMLVNGKQLKGTREAMLNQVSAGNKTGDQQVDITVHRNDDRNTVRFGQPSQYTRGHTPIADNFSCDATIDEFFLWKGAGHHLQQRALNGWLDGRYAKPLEVGEDPEKSEGVFRSQDIELPRDARHMPPPTAAVLPGGRAPTLALTDVSTEKDAEIVGMSWTVYGENGSDVIPTVVDASTGKPLQVDVVTYVKAGDRLHGPLRDDGFSPMSVRVGELEKARYLVRFQVKGLRPKSILLATPVVDDVTLYFRPAGGFRSLYWYAAMGVGE